MCILKFSVKKLLTKSISTISMLSILVFSIPLNVNAAAASPAVTSVNIVKYSDGLRYPNLVNTSGAVCDIFYNPSNTTSASAYIDVIQGGYGSSGNYIVTDNGPSVHYTPVVSRNIISGGYLAGYDEVFQINGLTQGYHQLKRLVFNSSSSILNGASSVLSDTIRVRVSQYKPRPEQTNIPINKTYILKFTKPVVIDANTKNYIKIYDSNANEVPVSFSAGPDVYSIAVHAPNGNYKPNSKYSLAVLPGLKSTSGQEMFSFVTMDFTTSSISNVNTMLNNSLIKSSIQKADLEISF